MACGVRLLSRRLLVLFMVVLLRAGRTRRVRAHLGRRIGHVGAVQLVMLGISGVKGWLLLLLASGVSRGVELSHGRETGGRWREASRTERNNGEDGGDDDGFRQEAKKVDGSRRRPSRSL